MKDKKRFEQLITAIFDKLGWQLVYIEIAKSGGCRILNFSKGSRMIFALDRGQKGDFDELFNQVATAENMSTAELMDALYQNQMPNAAPEYVDADELHDLREMLRVCRWFVERSELKFNKDFRTSNIIPAKGWNGNDLKVTYEQFVGAVGDLDKINVDSRSSTPTPSNIRPKLVELVQKYLYWTVGSFEDLSDEQLLSVMVDHIQQMHHDHEKSTERINRIFKALTLDSGNQGFITNGVKTDQIIRRINEMKNDPSLKGILDYLYGPLAKEANIPTDIVSKANPYELVGHILNAISQSKFVTEKHMNWLKTLASKVSVVINEDDTPFMLFEKIEKRLNMIENHIEEAVNLFQDPYAK